MNATGRKLIVSAQPGYCHTGKIDHDNDKRGATNPTRKRTMRVLKKRTRKLLDKIDMESDTV